jgi:hypothetical protein
VPDPVTALLRTRRTLLADVDLVAGSPEGPLVRSDASGTVQLYELDSGGLVELTSLPEPVAGAAYVPGARRAVLAIDEGGNERHQLYLIDLDDAAEMSITGCDQLHALTSERRFGHQLAGVSRDGRMLAYVSDRWPTASTLTCGCATWRAATTGCCMPAAPGISRFGVLSRRALRVGAAAGPASP